MDLVALGRFGLGLLVVAGLHALLRLVQHVGADLPRLLRPLLDPRLHYSVAGLFIGYTFLPSFQESFTGLALLALVFCGGWCGLAAGCGLDLRVVRRPQLLPLALEGGQAGLAVALVFLTAHVAGRFTESKAGPLGGPALLVICGICVVGEGVYQQLEPGKKGMKEGFWIPTLSPFLGILLLVLGSQQLNAAGFEIRSPLAPLARGVEVEGLGAKMVWSLVLGGAIGLLCDLLSREDLAPGVLFYLLAGGVLLGSGIAAVLGLEPAWIGLVAGAWLITATLRRLAVLRVVQEGHRFVRVGVLFIAGWFFGQGLHEVALDLRVFAWVLLLVVVLRPAVKLASLQAADRLLGQHVRHHLRQVAEVLDLDELALVMGLSLMLALPPTAGMAVLGALLVGQLLLRLAGPWLEPLAHGRAAAE